MDDPQNAKQCSPALVNPSDDPVFEQQRRDNKALFAIRVLELQHNELLEDAQKNAAKVIAEYLA